MKNYTVEKVHISKVNIGDTVLFEGHLKTVCRNNLKYCSFMGLTLFGDSFKLGRQLVERVNFIKVIK